MKSIRECCNIFNISNLKEENIETIKKKYYKLCLKYHPDKNISSNKNSNEHFINIKECYDSLIYIKIKENENNINNNDKSYTIYETIISMINIDNIQYITNILENYYNNNIDIIKLNTTLDKVFNKELYIYENNYIPLWHKYIYSKQLSPLTRLWFNNVFFYINIIDLPKNMIISNNNDIVIKLDKSKLILNTVIRLPELCIQFTITKNIVNNRKHTIYNRGIPKIDKKNIYNTTFLSDIIILF